VIWGFAVLQLSVIGTEAFHSTKPLYLLADDHSARLILNTQMLSWLQNSPDHEVRTESILNTRLAVASEILGLARTINRTGLCGREESSPFCLDAMYRSALIYGQLSQNPVISDARGALSEIKRGLEANNRRWKAAGTAKNLKKRIQTKVCANKRRSRGLCAAYPGKGHRKFVLKCLHSSVVYLRLPLSVAKMKCIS